MKPNLLLLLLSLLLLSTVSVDAQTDTAARGNDESTRFDQARGFYRTRSYGGAFIHTRGFGFNFRRGYRQGGFAHIFWGIDATNMKHPQEFRRSNPFSDDGRGYVYGKVNNVYIVRPHFGRVKELFGKERQRGVEVSYTYGIGPSLGLYKPIYMEIDSDEDGQKNIRYDPDIHSDDRIRGKAPFFVGIDNTSINPGVFGKVALMFEYSAYDETIRAIELGVNTDLYFRNIPILEYTYSRQLHATVYLNLFFGKKYL